ncbi:hypothetical protein RhiirA4_413070 [Rhizophagus irregularis]|uniref:Uncharacterized protein n=1 Tax=Rhizophagus irregularis TaxID=588596 RepID=A0A2I1HTJ8_9GLOM|nr:hypothetical protein RhiirA4_413070 [Rhizophagus irregularis]
MSRNPTEEVQEANIQSSMPKEPDAISAYPSPKAERTDPSSKAEETDISIESVFEDSSRIFLLIVQAGVLLKK